MKNRFVAGWRYPIQLDPALDDDEERRRGLALPKQGIAGFEIDDSCGRKQGLHRPRIETAEHGRLTKRFSDHPASELSWFNPSVVWTSACFVACCSRLRTVQESDLT